MIAEKQRDSQQAEKWYLKSLAIWRSRGRARRGQHVTDPVGRHCPGAARLRPGREVVSQVPGDQGEAGERARRAITYHQLGRIAQDSATSDRREVVSQVHGDQGEAGDEHGAASTYQQLGRIAQEQRDFAQAETWYLKSLAIKEKQGDEHGGQYLRTVGHLGRVAGPVHRIGTGGNQKLACLQKHP